MANGPLTFLQDKQTELIPTAVPTEGKGERPRVSEKFLSANWRDAKLLTVGTEEVT